MAGIPWAQSVGRPFDVHLGPGPSRALEPSARGAGLSPPGGCRIIMRLNDS